MKNLLLCLLFALFFAVGCGKQPVEVAPAPPPPPKAQLPAYAKHWAPLVERLDQDGFDRAWLIEIFSRREARFDPAPMRTKLKELFRLYFGRERNRAIQKGLNELGYHAGKEDGLAGAGTRRAIKAFQKNYKLPVDGEPTDALLAAIAKARALPAAQRPAPPKPPKKPKTTVKPRLNVYKSALTKQQLQKSLDFYRAHLPLLEKMQAVYGVPPELAVAIFTVETRLGEYLGKRKAVLALSSMALSSDYNVIAPHVQDITLTGVGQAEREFLSAKAQKRGLWAYNELKALLKYVQGSGADPLSVPGSIYGAIGIGQFMPSNALKYGVDGDNDGDIDLFELNDMTMSFGNYMADNGWNANPLPREQQRKAILNYNRSSKYVNTVLAIAEHLRRASNK